MDDFIGNFIRKLRNDYHIQVKPSFRQGIAFYKLLLYRYFRQQKISLKDVVEVAVLTTYYADQNAARKIAQQVLVNLFYENLLDGQGVYSITHLQKMLELNNIMQDYFQDEAILDRMLKTNIENISNEELGKIVFEEKQTQGLDFSDLKFLDSLDELHNYKSQLKTNGEKAIAENLLGEESWKNTLQQVLQEDPKKFGEIIGNLLKSTRYNEIKEFLESSMKKVDDFKDYQQIFRESQIFCPPSVDLANKMENHELAQFCEDVKSLSPDQQEEALNSLLRTFMENQDAQKLLKEQKAQLNSSSPQLSSYSASKNSTSSPSDNYDELSPSSTTDENGKQISSGLNPQKGSQQQGTEWMPGGDFTPQSLTSLDELTGQEKSSLLQQSLELGNFSLLANMLNANLVETTELMKNLGHENMETELVEGLAAGSGMNLLTQWFESHENLSESMHNVIQPIIEQDLIHLSQFHAKRSFSFLKMGSLLPQQGNRPYRIGDDIDQLDLEASFDNILMKGLPLSFFTHEDLVSFRESGKTMKILFLIDNSGSMKGKKLTIASMAAQIILYMIKSQEIAVYSFADNTSTIKKFDQRMETTQLANILTSLQAEGGTRIDRSLEMLLELSGDLNLQDSVLICMFSDLYFYEELVDISDRLQKISHLPYRFFNFSTGEINSKVLSIFNRHVSIRNIDISNIETFPQIFAQLLYNLR